MSVSINKNLCIGCGRCIDLCPGNLIKWDEGRTHARLKRPRDCWGCASCVKACPSEAIFYYLGADIGGTGMRMTTSLEGSLRIWTFAGADGCVRTIEVDGRDSNQY